MSSSSSTASQLPTRHRNHNGYFLRWDQAGNPVRPGEGTQRQMILAGLPVSAITHICITHFMAIIAGILQRLAHRRSAFMTLHDCTTGRCLARSAGVRQLVIGHFPQRYPDIEPRLAEVRGEHAAVMAAVEPDPHQPPARVTASSFPREALTFEQSTPGDAQRCISSPGSPAVGSLQGYILGRYADCKLWLPIAIYRLTATTL